VPTDALTAHFASPRLLEHFGAQPLAVVIAAIGDPAIPETFANPYHGAEQFGGKKSWSDTWFHGTRGSTPDLRTGRPVEEERGAGSGMGWPQPNKMLGTHFTPLHAVAHKFASGVYPSKRPGEPGYIPGVPSALVHARLHFRNPAHYPTEKHMNLAIAHWAQENHPLWHNDKLNEHAGWNWSDREGTHRDFSHPPEYKPGGSFYENQDFHHLASRAQELLQWHPHLPQILHDFTDSQIRSGHHGITYGNEVEGPGDASSDPRRQYTDQDVRHISAIATRPSQIESTRVEHIAAPRTEPQLHEVEHHPVESRYALEGDPVGPRRQVDSKPRRYSSQLNESKAMYGRIGAFHSKHGGAMPGHRKTAAMRMVQPEEYQHWSSADFPGHARDMTPEQHQHHKERALTYLHQDRGWEPGDIDELRRHWASRRTAVGDSWSPGTPLYHGALRKYKKGTVLTPEGRSPAGSIHSGDYVYATTSPESARYFGSMHDPSPETDLKVHVHRVVPVGDIESHNMPGEREEYSHGNYRAKAFLVTGHGEMPHTAAGHPPMQVHEYEGTTGNNNHITRTEYGWVPTAAVAHLEGVSGERPGSSPWHRTGQDWEDFKHKIDTEGIRDHVFITVDHGHAPKISEGNQRRDAAVELGHSHVPVEINYYGHAEHQGTVEERMNRGKNVRWCPHCGEARYSKPAMIKHIGEEHPEYRTASADWVWYHGTPDERTWKRGGQRGLHAGTYEAARQALEATIGTPAEGEWDGTREYGRTPIVSNEKRMGYATGLSWRDKGTPRHENAKYMSGHPVPLDARPSIIPVRIAGPMHNSPENPMDDEEANNRILSSSHHGFYYHNVGEDAGSVSAVVPSASHFERVNCHQASKQDHPQPHPGPPREAEAGRKLAAMEGYVWCRQGHRHWGRHGAAGLLIRHQGDDGQTRYLLQHRSPNVQHGDTWSTPGGAMHEGEAPERAARRETEEEWGKLPQLTHHHTEIDDHGSWKYHTVIMDSPHRFEPRGGGSTDWESAGHGWFTPDEMSRLQLHPGFAASWPKISKQALAVRCSGKTEHLAVTERQQAAFDVEDMHLHRRQMLDVARDREPGTTVWRGERRPASEQPEDITSTGIHWSANPDSIILGHAQEHQRIHVLEGEIEHPDQAFDRSHPIWRGRHESFDHEAEVRFKPGARVKVKGIWSWHPYKPGPGEHPLTGQTPHYFIPRHPERMHPSWHYTPLDKHITAEWDSRHGGASDYRDAGIEPGQHYAARQDQAYWHNHISGLGEGIHQLPNTPSSRRAIGRHLDQQGMDTENPLRGVLEHDPRGTHNLIHRGANGIDAGINYTHNKRDRSLDIHNVRVLPKREGIGTSMLREMAKLHPDAREMTVYGAVPDAKPWYSRNGAAFVPWSSMGRWDEDSLDKLRKESAARHVVVYHGAHHDDIASIRSRGLDPSANGATVTTDRAIAEAVAGTRDWNAPRVIEFHIPAGQPHAYLDPVNEPEYALKQPLPPHFIHAVHDVVPSWQLHKEGARGYNLHDRSGMISLDMPPDVRDRLAHPNGVDDHHITLVYLGPDVGDETWELACKRAREAAAMTPGPQPVLLEGIDSFEPSEFSDGKRPAYVPATMPAGLHALRDNLADLQHETSLPFVPHVSLAYLDPGEPMPLPFPPTQVDFHGLSVHRGRHEVARFPFRS
jgi:8-oxo-dGTP diphosphatase